MSDHFATKVIIIWQKHSAKLTDWRASSKINNGILSLNGFSKFNIEFIYVNILKYM